MDGIKFSNGNIGYKHIPKNACTSIKESIYSYENGLDFDSIDHKKNIHEYYIDKYESISKCKYRVIILRDPIKRFLSAYSNRVTHHNELSGENVSKTNPFLAKKITTFNPGLGQFLDNFHQYSRVNSIKHHIKPIEEICSGDISIFTHIYPIEKIADFELFVSQQSEKKFTLGRSQTGGKKYWLQDLSNSQMQFLLEFYKKDYELLSDFYSIDSIWHEYKKGFKK